MKAIRGAITASANSSEAIAQATRKLLNELVRRNNLVVEETVSILFSMTPDLNADFPARAAREGGWDVPMLEAVEIDVPGALPRCIRIMMHVETDRAVKHAYVGEARVLRPDLASEPQ